MISGQLNPQQLAEAQAMLQSLDLPRKTPSPVMAYCPARHYRRSQTPSARSDRAGRHSMGTPETRQGENVQKAAASSGGP